MPQVKSIAFTMYSVKDLARARNFYEDKLGLKVTLNHADKWIEYEMAGGCFAITTLAPEIEPSATAGGSIAFEVEDMRELTKKLEQDGIQIAMPPTDLPHCSMSVVIDPEGNALTLHQLGKDRT